MMNYIPDGALMIQYLQPTQHVSPKPDAHLNIIPRDAAH